ncbi:hypothetical protein, partial [Mesorhizobium captivum]|uniref:hypothetical protein n=1 Tax=Mesorhizobium captivum TaxID=3072319 RepID=UPI002A24614A
IITTASIITGTITTIIITTARWLRRRPDFFPPADGKTGLHCDDRTCLPIGIFASRGQGFPSLTRYLMERAAAFDPFPAAPTSLPTG